MTNHHSDSSAAEEIYRILPMFVGPPTDEVKRGFGLIDNVETERTVASLMPRTEECAGQKIFLPWRANGPRFAPQQYYYAASKSGVVPSWVISAAAHPA